MNIDNQNKVYDLIKKIDDPATYRDSPVLKEIISVLDSDKDNSLFNYQLNAFIADKYEDMGRLSLSAIYRYNALEILSNKEFNYDESDAKDLLYRLLRDRNFYVDDDCEDIKELALNVISEDIANEIYASRMKNRRSFNQDPIEMSEEYLNVIDEIEEKIEKNRTIYGMGSCHEVWRLKRTYLLEKGIKWKSPSELNPRVRFD